MRHVIWCIVGKSRLAVLFLLLAACSVGCNRTNRAASNERQTVTVNVSPYFQDITIASGLPAPTSSYPDGTFALPEISPGGVALFDYDNDGRLDILQVCHGPPGQNESVPNRLFHQEANGTFREVPDAGGIRNHGYADGVAIGDYDNDGFPDVFVTAFGRNTLYHNNRDGSFTDVTRFAGLPADDNSWSLPRHGWITTGMGGSI